ncbi:DUF3953 domain-containing protein [Clostridium sp. AL.422]|uniref:DUF3953 domain-containing protein n=1 Tax=Clostridium TaxID=1485 RepID=UPI00293DC0E4|nr:MULTISPECIES: DUF3953 domain-containing protein [unclassified Clostridium]MDV4150861.1 DUF3953 domain-containing protein [Clostridium sp. AL.422]
MIKEVWSSKSTSKKVLSIISVICSIIIIVLACMQIFGIWENAINVFEPLLGVVLLIQAIQNWKKNKVVAIVNLCAAIFIFLVWIFIFVIR